MYMTYEESQNQLEEQFKQQQQLKWKQLYSILNARTVKEDYTVLLQTQDQTPEQQAELAFVKYEDREQPDRIPSDQIVMKYKDLSEIDPLNYQVFFTSEVQSFYFDLTYFERQFALNKERQCLSYHYHFMVSLGQKIQAKYPKRQLYFKTVSYIGDDYCGLEAYGVLCNPDTECMNCCTQFQRILRIPHYSNPLAFQIRANSHLLYLFLFRRLGPFLDMRQFHMSVPAEGHELTYFKDFWQNHLYLFMGTQTIKFFDALVMYRLMYKDFVDYNDDLYFDVYCHNFLITNGYMLEIPVTIDEEYTLYKHNRDKKALKLQMNEPMLYKVLNYFGLRQQVERNYFLPIFEIIGKEKLGPNRISSVTNESTQSTIQTENNNDNLQTQDNESPNKSPFMKMVETTEDDVQMWPELAKDFQEDLDYQDAIVA